MAQGILVFIEQRDGSVRKSSLEALGAARSIADELQEKVTAYCVGPDSPAMPVAHYGADAVVCADHALLKSYSAEAYSAGLAELAGIIQPRVVLASASAMGRDFMPRMAARLRVGLAQDCIELGLSGDKQLSVKRPIYAGKAYERVRLVKTPAVATLRPNVFAPMAADASRSATVEPFAPALEPSGVRSRCTGTLALGGQKIELTEANIIVSGGRGVKGPEHFPMIQALAEALGGAMGASRAAVDAGWIGHSYQVGQTGKTVSPTLYVACGISGAIQHLAGMSSSKYIVAINKDPDAPIFKLADYGIVGDLFEIVPALVQAVKKLSS